MGRQGPITPGVLLHGRWRVGVEIARGGMGAVWRGVDEGLGRDVAIKVPHAPVLATEEGRLRFEREVQRLTRLAHPHIVRILDSRQHHQVPYAVLTYVGGGTLVDLVSARGHGTPWHLSPGDLFPWLTDAASALDFIHAHGVVHRDLKPTNLLFDAAGSVHVGDFGIAKALEGESSLTPPGILAGTPIYVAPEAVLEAEPTPAVDQYALAVIVYETLCGVPPFSMGPPHFVLMQKVRHEAPSLRVVAPFLPSALADVVDRALRRDPRERYATCTAFAEAVEKAT